MDSVVINLQQRRGDRQCGSVVNHNTPSTKERLLLTICELAHGGRQWACELCVKHGVSRVRIYAVIRYARNVEHLDIAKVVADLDARGFFTSIFRAAIIERKIWATVMLWEHGVTFDTLQEMLEAGQLEDE